MKTRIIEQLNDDFMLVVPIEGASEGAHFILYSEGDPIMHIPKELIIGLSGTARREALIALAVQHSLDTDIVEALRDMS